MGLHTERNVALARPVLIPQRATVEGWSACSGLCVVVSEDPSVVRAAAELNAPHRCVVVSCSEQQLVGIATSFRTTHIIVDERHADLDGVLVALRDRSVVEVTGAADASSLVQLIQAVIARIERARSET